MVRLINEMALLKLTFGSFLRNFGMLEFDTLSTQKVSLCTEAVRYHSVRTKAGR